MTNTLLNDYMRLFEGRRDAYGLGAGKVVRCDPDNVVGWEDLYESHLKGEHSGLGVFPLLDSGEVNFAAIDLDEPDFKAAREMQEYLPGVTWVERSRSGNAHVWVFFSKPIEAWVPRGILRYATEAIGKTKVEVFPKQDRLLEGMVGNYINLCYHGKDRPILYGGPDEPYPLETFVEKATGNLNDPDHWRKRARWLEIPTPEERERDRGEFGAQPFLHICAEHIIANRENNPIVEGHRAVVYFNLAKMLLNYEGFDRDESLYYLELVNDSSPDPVTRGELVRMLDNAERGQFVSTGCDNTLMEPYIHPDCPIAKGHR